MSTELMMPRQCKVRARVAALSIITIFVAIGGERCDAYISSVHRKTRITPVVVSATSTAPSEVSVISHDDASSTQRVVEHVGKPYATRRRSVDDAASYRDLFLGDYNGPRTVTMLLLGLMSWRIILSSDTVLGLDDLAASALAVVFWWLQEHWMHKYLLHSDRDWEGKQIHENHHLKPYHHISIDAAPLMLGWLTTVHVILRSLLPLPIAITTTIAYSAAGLFYEWSHFIVHTKVRFPHGSFWQRMKDHHIRHHLIDSNYWLAFSVTQVDDLFGTNPNVEAVKSERKALVGTLYKLTWRIRLVDMSNGTHRLNKR